jgi:diaminopimelate epimerase
MEINEFVKSHGLGNDYVVFDAAKISFPMNTNAIKRICNVHYGIGSDGILLLVPSSNADFGLKIYNPDGSEAEKSGNGLRIFCKFLYDYQYTQSKTFSVETLGGIVTATINELRNNKAFMITIDMGKANFTSAEIPVKCATTECLDHKLIIDNQQFIINCVSVGNPHCVIITDKLDYDLVMKYGALIENHSMFPNRINVQFAKVISKSEVEILIWERGAGYTLASGSSSSAVASVLYKKGLTGSSPTICMPGGKLQISLSPDFDIKLCGEVRQIASGILDAELLADLNNVIYGI